MRVDFNFVFSHGGKSYIPIGLKISLQAELINKMMWNYVWWFTAEYKDSYAGVG